MRRSDQWFLFPLQQLILQAFAMNQRAMASHLFTFVGMAVVLIRSVQMKPQFKVDMYMFVMHLNEQIRPGDRSHAPKV